MGSPPNTPTPPTQGKALEPPRSLFFSNNIISPPSFFPPCCFTYGVPSAYGLFPLCVSRFSSAPLPSSILFNPGGPSSFLGLPKAISPFRTFIRSLFPLFLHRSVDLCSLFFSYLFVCFLDLRSPLVQTFLPVALPTTATSSFSRGVFFPLRGPEDTSRPKASLGPQM